MQGLIATEEDSRSWSWGLARLTRTGGPVGCRPGRDADGDMLCLALRAHEEARASSRSSQRTYTFVYEFCTVA